jgi:hypothetical protein
MKDNWHRVRVTERVRSRVLFAVHARVVHHLLYSEPRGKTIQNEPLLRQCPPADRLIRKGVP